MEEAIDFIRAFIKKEYEALVAQWSERRDDIFAAKKRDVQRFYGRGLIAKANRPTPSDDEWFEKGAEQLDMLQPRVLFQVKYYRHPTFGDLYRCYVSSTTKFDDAEYFSCLYVANTEHGLKIVAQYNLCFTCNGTGMQGGKSCPDCNFNGWNWRGGVKLETLGKLVEVRKFQAPDHPEQMKEYNAE